MVALPALPPPVLAPAVLPTAAVVTADSSGTHTVRPGETLSAIAVRYGTTTAALAAANDLADPDRIQAGTHLRVPSSVSSRSTGAPSTHVHVVRAGDTLSGIAARYDVPLAGLLKANRRSASSLIHPGDRVTVPGSGSSRRVASSTKAATRPDRSADPAPDTFLGVQYPSSVAEAAARNRRVLASRQVPSRTEVRSLVERTAARHGVDPRLRQATTGPPSVPTTRA
jgi:LysM repeat protein